MAVLITGASGFVGKTVRRLCDSVGLELAGDPVDITDAAAVIAAVRSVQPSAVMHLAARSFVPESVADPLGVLQVNFLGTLHLLQALRTSGFRGRLLYASSAEVYGAVETGRLPVREEHPLEPRSPYAMSKVAAEALCGQDRLTGVFEVVVARPFNHIGPGQSARFVVADCARQIANIRRGQSPPVIHVGDIDTTRDFTDVRDVARAYVSLLERGQSGEAYNVCSGVERSIRSVLDRLLELAGVRAEVRPDPQRYRQEDRRRMFGSYDKLHKDTGWTPQIPWEHTLQSILDYWSKDPGCPSEH